MTFALGRQLWGLPVARLGGILSSPVGKITGALTRSACVLIALCAALVVSDASAQETPKVITPPEVTTDPNEVNLLTGQAMAQRPTLTIPAAPRLTFTRASDFTMYLEGQSDNYTRGTSYFAVHYGGDRSESFQCTNGVCYGDNSASNLGGSVLGTGSLTLEKTGVRYAFTLKTLDDVDPTTNTRFTESVASSVSYPDGEVLTLSYQPYDSGTVTNQRVSKVSSNTGYFLELKYWDSLGTLGWNLLQTATIYATSAPTTALARLSYSQDGKQVTDLSGRTWACTLDCGQYGFESPWTPSDAVTLPTESNASLVYTSNATNGFLLSGIQRDGVGWNYSYSGAVSEYVQGALKSFKFDAVQVTGPNGYSKTYGVQNTTTTLANKKYKNDYVKSSTDELGRVTAFAYEPFAKSYRLQKITYPEQNSATFVYDAANNIIKRTDTAKPGSGLAALVLEAGYDLVGCSGVTCWRPTWYKDALLRQTDYRYNSSGQLTKQLDPADQNGNRRLVLITYAASTAGLSRKSIVRVCTSSSTNIDTAACSGSALSRTDFTGYEGNTDLPTTVAQVDEAAGTSRTTATAYDAAGRVASVDGPLTGTDDARYFRYDLAGRKQWEIGERGPNGLRLAKKFTYRDSDDKVSSVQTGTVSCSTNCATAALSLNLLQATDTGYDSRRYPIRETAYKGTSTYAVTDLSFLDRGLAECTAVRMNLTSLPASAPHSACTLGTEGTVGADRITKNNYDNAGQLTLVQKAYGTQDEANYAGYSYTANGKQEYVTDANGNKAQYKHDGFDRLSCWILPSKTTAGAVSGDCVTSGDYEKYGYDANGNRTSLRKRDGSTLTYAYDGTNRLTTKTVPARTGLTATQTRDVFYTYDSAGQQLSARFDSSAATSDGVTNSYNGFGELVSSTLQMGTFSKALSSYYDAAGRRIALVHPEGTSTYAFTYCYDALSRLTSIRNGASCSAAALESFTYSDAGLTQTRGEGSTGVSSATYGWDDVGRLTSHADVFGSSTAAQNVNWAFQFNPASQILQETRSTPNSTTDPYAYPDLASTSHSYGVNGLNQIVSNTSAGTTSNLIYDANGNLTSDGTRTYTYDVENRLVKAVGGGTTVNLTYDPLGRLYQTDKGTTSTTTRFLHDGDAMVLEFNSSNVVTDRYVHGSNAASDDPLVWYSGSTLGTVRFLHADHLGSIVGIASSTGASFASNSYDEYGLNGSTNNTNERFGYTGQAYIPELGLYYYKARFYSPPLGRFLQTDPIGDEGGMNLYAYVGDDPVNMHDPNGEEAASVTCANHACGEGSLSISWHDFEDVLAVASVFIPTLRMATAIRSDTAAIKALQLAKNKAAGKAGEAATRAKLGETVAGEQVSFRTSTGKRSRVDFVTKDRQIVESKAGRARLSPAQRDLKQDVDRGRPVTPVGDNAKNAGLTPGEPLKMKGCIIDRTC